MSFESRSPPRDMSFARAALSVQIMRYVMHSGHAVLLRRAGELLEGLEKSCSRAGETGCSQDAKWAISRFWWMRLRAKRLFESGMPAVCMQYVKEQVCCGGAEWRCW